MQNDRKTFKTKIGHIIRTGDECIELSTITCGKAKQKKNNSKKFALKHVKY